MVNGNSSNRFRKRPSFGRGAFVEASSSAPGSKTITMFPQWGHRTTVPVTRAYTTSSAIWDGLPLVAGPFLGIQRTDDIVQIQVFWAAGKTVDAKLAMYKKIVERLAVSPGVRPEDVLISVVESAAENWSFGNGETQFYKLADHDGALVHDDQPGRSKAVAHTRL